MTLSSAQKNLLITLTCDLPYGRPYLKNQFKNHVLDACVRKGLIELYHYRRYLHEAVRLTEEGKRVLVKLSQTDCLGNHEDRINMINVFEGAKNYQ